MDGGLGVEEFFEVSFTEFHGIFEWGMFNESWAAVVTFDDAVEFREYELAIAVTKCTPVVLVPCWIVQELTEGLGFAVDTE